MGGIARRLAAVVLLTVITEPVPHIPPERRYELRPLGHGIFRLLLRYGFVESPDVPAVLAALRTPELHFPPMDTTYFLSRDTILVSTHPGMARWRKRLFVFLWRNALDAAVFFRLPPNRVVELGMQVEL